ncbi:unknown [Coraliomargarita sp. CAG:312]|nr:unknown [Coraliomargarita sp. CAG:312]
MPEFTKGKSLSVNGSEDLDKFSSGKFKHASKATLLLPAGEYKISAR